MKKEIRNRNKDIPKNMMNLILLALNLFFISGPGQAESTADRHSSGATHGARAIPTDSAATPVTSNYKITIFTDQTPDNKAQEVIQTFRSTYPFNQYEIEFEVVSMTTADLNCNPDPDIDRLLVCDTTRVASDAAERGSDQAFIVSSYEQYGGSGGGIPVISSGSTPRMMLHEYLHSLGLCDEYEYSESEAVRFCQEPPLQNANQAVITPRASYANDGEARSAHREAISWYSHILDSTLITNTSGTQLGTGAIALTPGARPNSGNTPIENDTPIGLYRGRTCNNAVPVKVSWHPGGSASIMDDLSYGLGRANEVIVQEILESRGLRRTAASLAAEPIPTAAPTVAPSVEVTPSSGGPSGSSH